MRVFPLRGSVFLKFWKMNGAGNDFVVLNNLEEHLPVERLPQMAQTFVNGIFPSAQTD